ncbi:phage holin, LLH family [Leuconostoc citreum]|uniref:phage holin, LLH family n=1 Tax=Leuconostoc citreum TaxID=33964 RepID=UPI0032DFFCFE
MGKTDVWGVFVALWTSGVLTAVGHAVIRLVQANAKNKNILSFTKWAEQGVQYAETLNVSSEEKKQAAIKVVYDRLIANKLPFTFSDEQVSAEIETAVAKLHNWHPEIKQEINNDN